MKEFQVKSKGGAASHESNGRKWAAIQVCTNDGEWPELSDTDRKGLLRLYFFDGDHDNLKARAERMGTSLFEESHAKEIVDFVNEHWDDVDYFLVHCEAGLSRSPAIAAACQKMNGMDDNVWFKEKTPNMRVYRKILEYNAGQDEK